MSNPDSTNESKANGLGRDPMERLASFKPTRNLTLGGPKLNKKIFVPNLNVTRNKNKSTSSNSHDHKKQEKTKTDRKGDRNKSHKNGPSNIIKSGGIFSEGPGRAANVGSRQSSGYGVETPTIHKPVLRVKDVKAIDRELEEQKIKAMMASGTGENVDVEDFKGSVGNEAPIKLPVDDGWTIPSSKPVKVKQEVVIKTEEDSDLEAKTDIKPLVPLKTDLFENTDVVNLLRTPQPGLILIKMPESLPGRGGAAHGLDEDNPAAKCVLKDLEEGRIGKLRVHRSGRVTLALGNNNLEVNLGKQSVFYQEVVSVGVDERSRAARMISLGCLQQKLVVVPEWETLLKDVPS